MMFEPSQTQEPGSPTTCPKNPFGHSWKGIATLEGKIQQRCRFCQLTREVRVPPSQQKRQQPRSADVMEQAAQEQPAPL